MSASFLHPGWLWLLVLVPIVWLVPRRASDVVHAAVRTAVVVLVVLALARIALVGRDRDAHHVYVLDRSESATAESRRRAGDALAARLAATGGARSTVITLGAAADGERAFDRSTIHVDRSALGAALAASARAIPDDAFGAVTVISDGLATERAWGPALQTLTERGIPVHACVLDARGDDVRPVALHVPDRVTAGETARIVVDVAAGAVSRAGAGGAADDAPGAVVTVRLRVDGRDVAVARDVEVRGVTSVALEFEPAEPGYVALEAVIDGADDAVPDDDTLAGALAVQDPLRVLYLGARMTGGAERMAELLGAGFTVEPYVGEGLPDADALREADLVVLDDRPASAVPVPFQETLRQAVTEDGLGLVVAGGPASFGPGGFEGTPIADVLPVEFVKKEEKRDPSTALVVIIDTSGSMGGGRVQLAKEVSRLAMRRLLPHDKVGIVEFYGAKRWAAPIQPASNTIELERALNRLQAGGGTVILPAIEEAFYALQNVRTRYKHVLVITDGGVESGAFEPLLRKMSDRGMNVSTVLIGPDAHSEFLVTLANWGKGRFYSVPNRFNLPEILLKQPASANLPGYRGGAHALAARGGTGWWGGVAPDRVPDLEGYVETRARPGADVLLETKSGAHPVLASWHHGLGRATAFTTEPTGPGTRPWRAWDGYGPLLARVARRTAGDARHPFAFEVSRTGVDVTVTARRRIRTDARPAAWRLDAAGDADREVEFRRRAPDVFTATFAHDPSGEVRLLAGVRGAATREGRVRLISTARADVAHELQVDPRRALDLKRVAAETGGMVLAIDALPTAVLATGGGRAPTTVLRLWPWFLALALAFYIADLAWRRRPGAIR